MSAVAGDERRVLEPWRGRRSGRDSRGGLAALGHVEATIEQAICARVHDYHDRA